MYPKINKEEKIEQVYFFFLLLFARWLSTKVVLPSPPLLSSLSITISCSFSFSLLLGRCNSMYCSNISKSRLKRSSIFCVASCMGHKHLGTDSNMHATFTHARTNFLTRLTFLSFQTILLLDIKKQCMCSSRKAPSCWML